MDEFLDVKLISSNDDIKQVVGHINIKDKLFSYPTSLHDVDFIREDVLYYGLYKENTLIGIGIMSNSKELVPDDKSWAVDVAILPEFRGKVAYDLCKKCIEYHIDTQNSDKLYAIISEDNRPSLYFSLHMGFKKICDLDGHVLLEYKTNDRRTR